MYIEEIVWLEAIVDKLAVKHAVLPDEVEEVLSNNPKKLFKNSYGHYGSIMVIVG